MPTSCACHLGPSVHGPLGRRWQGWEPGRRAPRTAPPWPLVTEAPLPGAPLPVGGQGRGYLYACPSRGRPPPASAPRGHVLSSPDPHPCAPAVLAQPRGRGGCAAGIAFRSSGGWGAADPFAGSVPDVSRSGLPSARGERGAGHGRRRWRLSLPLLLRAPPPSPGSPPDLIQPEFPPKDPFPKDHHVGAKGLSLWILHLLSLCREHPLPGAFPASAPAAPRVASVTTIYTSSAALPARRGHVGFAWACAPQDCAAGLSQGPLQGLRQPGRWRCSVATRGMKGACFFLWGRREPTGPCACGRWGGGGTRPPTVAGP